jgi:hypothetical protein
MASPLDNSIVFMMIRGKTVAFGPTADHRQAVLTAIEPKLAEPPF